MNLKIIYSDEYIVAINKPHGLMVHRSEISTGVTEFAMLLLRDQLNRLVYPLHRLDRKTGGVLLFGLSEEIDSLMQQKFQSAEVAKTYWAIVRGFTSESGTINSPLMKDNGVMQQAVTHFRTLKYAELDVPFGDHATSRYSLVEVTPETGRMHQIRRHFDHIRHPIIGDRSHGCNKQNKLFKEKWGITALMLHATAVQFMHPITGINLEINAQLQPEFIQTMEIMGWNE